MEGTAFVGAFIDVHGRTMYAALEKVIKNGYQWSVICYVSACVVQEMIVFMWLERFVLAHKTSWYIMVYSRIVPNNERNPEADVALQ